MNRMRRCSIAWLVTLAPLAAAAVLAQQDPLPPPGPGLVAPHDFIESARQLIDGLQDQKVITEGLALSLRVKLTDAREALWRADAGASIRHLGAYGNQVEALGRGGALPSQVAMALGQYGAAAIVLIGQIAFDLPSVLSDVKPGCGQSIPCPQPLVLYVSSAKARLAPDGSQDRPFRTIADALVAADEAKACAVEIHLAAGSYSGSLVIARNTRIFGEETQRTIIRGSVVNEGGHDLELRGLTLASSPAPGGVVVRTCPANVELARVVINGATRNGVRQEGGALRMFAVQVRDTVAQSDSVYAGSGVRLTGGTRAVIGLSRIDGSGSVGLSVSGPETRAYVAASLISSSRANPAFEAGIASGDPGYGGAEVSDGALLLMQLTNIRDNEIFGLIARDSGRVHFRYGSISGTMERRLGRFSAIGGINVLTQTDGIVHTTEFRDERAELVGYLVGNGFATAFRGILSHNEIGLVFRGIPPPSDPGYDLPTAAACVCNAVALVRNRTSFETPHPEDLIGGSPCSFGPPPVFCRTVPMVCDWCGS